jgi:hypothetical protein
MGEGSSRNELIGALSIVILFITILIGREAGHFYADYQELSKLKVLLEVSEEELTRYFITSDGTASEVKIGLTITLPNVENEADVVTETPDYVRRWLISVTLSPITVRQPSVSDVQLEMLVEGETVMNKTYAFQKRKVSYLGYIDRELNIQIDDLESVKNMIDQATSKYGGEVKIELRGKVKAHLWLLDNWLPFSTTRYPFLEAPHLHYIDSEWSNQEGISISESTVNKTVFVRVKLSNPTRFHTIRENITCTFYKNGETQTIDAVKKEIPLAAADEGYYIFFFTPAEKGVYIYSLKSREKTLVNMNESSTLNIINP